MIEEAKGEAGSYLHTCQVLRELEKVMPDDVMVSTDIGNINSVANCYLRFDQPVWCKKWNVCYQAASR